MYVPFSNHLLEFQLVNSEDCSIENLPSGSDGSSSDLFQRRWRHFSSRCLFDTAAKVTSLSLDPFADDK